MRSPGAGLGCLNGMPSASTPAFKNRPYTIWFDGIGALSYQKAQKQTVGFNTTTGAALLGLDAVINSQSLGGRWRQLTATRTFTRKRTLGIATSIRNISSFMELIKEEISILTHHSGEGSFKSIK